MRYINGKEILPEELLNEVRKYAEGLYVYIPKSDFKKNKWGDKTNYHMEMEFRNQHIYEKYLEGIDFLRISECYHLTIKSIRRIVLIQKRKMEPVKIMIKELIKKWDINADPVQIHCSAWNILNSYVLKVYENPNTLMRNVMMMRILHEEGIPVPEIIALPDGRDYLENNGKYYLLTTKLNGKNIVDLNQFHYSWFSSFGNILANLHKAFAKCEGNISYMNKSMFEEMNGWVKRDLMKFHPEYLLTEDIFETINELSEIYIDLPKQLIHRDVHLGNFLFEDGVFSGYIDFDLSQRNIRIFDICYFLLGILLKEDSNKVDEQKWFEIVKNVVQGYSEILELEFVEKSAVTCVMKNIELLFVAYFLGCGDEKSARDSVDLFYFIKRNESKIKESLLVPHNPFK